MTPSPGQTLREVRERKPLVHQITNYVVMNETANATLALGALPVMAHAREEVEEMVALAGALVLNIGTLSPHWIEAMLLAGKAANEHGVPVVLDPVGAGATRFRTETARRLLDEVKVAVLRGNQVSDGERVLAIANGHELLSAVTGTGCMSSAITGCFLAVQKDAPLEAAAEALAAFGLAGEDAAREANGPGSFHLNLYADLAAVEPALTGCVGAGPIWTARSNTDADPPIRLSGLRAIWEAVWVRGVAIGGVEAANAGECIRAGAAGVAVIRAVRDSAALRTAIG